MGNATENYGKGEMGKCLMGTEVQFLQDETNSEDSTVWSFLIPLNCTLTMICHLMHIRMAFVKKARKNSACENVEKGWPLCTDGGNVNCYSHYGRQYGDSSNN